MKYPCRRGGRTGGSRDVGTHSVTHVDAPWHYNSEIEGTLSTTVDELPLEWFFADIVVVDMTHKADGEKIEAAEVERALARFGYELKPRDIVLVRTGREAFYGQPDYVFKECAATAGATRWLYERGARVMEIDGSRLIAFNRWAQSGAGRGRKVRRARRCQAARGSMALEPHCRRRRVTGRSR
jgi:kynurenine formamidase